MKLTTKNTLTKMTEKSSWQVLAVMLTAFTLVQTVHIPEKTQESGIMVSVDDGVSVGRPITLHCTAGMNDVPTKEISWSEGGMPLKNCDKMWATVQSIELFKSDLTLHNVSQFDLGQYTCSIQYRGGTTLSSTTTLHTQDDKSVPIIETITLNYQASYNASCAEAEHIFVKKSSSSGVTFTGHSSAQYRVKMMSLADQSKVVCINQEGRVTRITYIVADYKPISFIQPNETATVQSVDNLSPAVMHCKVSGPPGVKLEWRKGNQAISNFQGYTELTRGPNSLSLRLPVYYDQFFGGRYVCRASSVWETVERSIVLANRQPKQKETWYSISSFTATEVVKAGDNITLNCSANVDLLINIHGWISKTENKQTVSLDTMQSTRVGSQIVKRTFTATIPNATPSDSGVYKCTIFSLRVGATVTRHVSVFVLE